MSRQGSSFSNTLTFMASVGMVSASLSLVAQQRPGIGGVVPVSVDGSVAHCSFDSGVWALDATGSATSTPAGGLLMPASGPCSNKQLAAELCFDDASPLSSSSRVQLLGAGSLTPSSVESCGRLVLDHTISSTQQQQQQQLAVQRQQQAKRQLLQLPQQTQHPAAHPAGVLGGGTTVEQAGTAQWTWQQPHALLLQQPAQAQLMALFPQSSGSLTSAGSLTSSTCIGMVPGAASNNVTSTAAATTAWQQLLHHQQLQLVQQQQAGRQQLQLIAAARPLRATSSSGGATGSSSSSSSTLLVKRLAPTSSSDYQPAAKKAATQAAMAAMLQASNSAAAWRVAAPQQLPLVQQQPQQQLFLLPTATGRSAAQAWNSRLPPTGLARQRHQQQSATNLGATTLALVSASSAAAAAAAAAAGLAAAAAAAPMPVLESTQQKLLHWAGRVLNCQLQDAYLLCCHLYRRVSGQLDDMLLISLGVTASTESVTMLVSLWVASKLEGHRRQVAGASKLAAALQLLPGSITDIELHVMQRLNWQPYAGWAARTLVD